jgi:hypothetical protein
MTWGLPFSTNWTFLPKALLVVKKLARLCFLSDHVSRTFRVRLLFLFSQFLVALLVLFRFASGIDLGNWISQVDGEVTVSSGVEEHL